MVVAAVNRSSLELLPSTTAISERPSLVALAEMQTPAPKVVPVLRPVMPSYRRSSLLVLTSWVAPSRRLSVHRVV